MRFRKMFPREIIVTYDFNVQNFYSSKRITRIHVSLLLRSSEERGDDGVSKVERDESLRE